MIAARASRRARPAVLQVVLALRPGGTERLVVETVRRLSAQYRMTVCCLDDPGEWGDELRREGFPVVALDRRPGFRPGLGWKIAALAADCGARVLHCHHYSPFVYACVARALRPRLRVIFTEHGRLSDGPPSSKRRMVNRVLARVPHQVYAVSADLRRHMLAEGFGGDQVTVLHNGIDPGDLPAERDRQEVRRLLGVPDEAFLIGATGRLDPVKDLGTLIDAVALIGREVPGARLVLVGDGPERGRLEDRARTAGISERVSFLGQRSDARRLYGALDAYASSSTFEGVSLTILEAMAAGRPVVATRVGGTPEVVDDGRTGWLVPPRDAAGMAATLLSIARDPERAAAVGGAARARLLEHFTLERMINQYGAAYQALGAD